MTFLRCSCGLRVDADTRPDAWLLLDQHIETTHGRTFPLGSRGSVVWDSTGRVASKPKPKRLATS